MIASQFGVFLASCSDRGMNMFRFDFCKSYTCYYNTLTFILKPLSSLVEGSRARKFLELLKFFMRSKQIKLQKLQSELFLRTAIIKSIQKCLLFQLLFVRHFRMPVEQSNHFSSLFFVHRYSQFLISFHQIFCIHCSQLCKNASFGPHRQSVEIFSLIFGEKSHQIFKQNIVIFCDSKIIKKELLISLGQSWTVISYIRHNILKVLMNSLIVAKLIYLLLNLFVKALTKVLRCSWVNPTSRKLDCFILWIGLVKQSLTFMGLPSRRIRQGKLQKYYKNSVKEFFVVLLLHHYMGKIQQLNAILSALSAIYPKSTNVLKIIGTIVVLKKVLSVLCSLYKTWLRPKKNLIKRYGAKSWALVTGSSEGIGKSIAIELAKKGFNIVLSARTQSKLESAKKEIQQKYPSIQVRLLVVDYSQAARPTYLQERLSELDGLDISMLVNNVGVDVLDYYHNLKEEQIIKLININCTAMSLLCRLMLPKMMTRDRRSAIVNVASLAGEIPMALHNVYSASKAYVDFLSRALSYEYDHKIDIISLRPSEVSTPMTYNKQTDIMTIKPEDCARGLLNDLGHDKVTNGHWSHCLQGKLYHLVPECLFNYVFLKHLGPEFMRDRERARRRQ